MKLQGLGRIQSYSAARSDGRITGLTMTAVLDGQMLDIRIFAPDGKCLEEAADEGLNLDVEIER